MLQGSSTGDGTTRPDCSYKKEGAKAEFSTRIVVNASGPWANVIGKMVGLTYPIQVTREQEVLLRPQTPVDCPKVSVSDMCNAIYFHPFGKELLVGRAFPKEYEEVDPDHHREGSDPEFVEEVVERTVKRVPSMASAMILKGYSGLYEVTPDWHPMICRHPELEGFFTAVGFSGHGFQIGTGSRRGAGRADSHGQEYNH